MLVEPVVDSGVRFPATFEVERVGAVDILLALITEGGPYAERTKHIAWVKLDDAFAHACGIVVGETVLTLCAVTESGREVKVLELRALKRQQAMEVETFERCEHDICGPALWSPLAAA